MRLKPAQKNVVVINVHERGYDRQTKKNGTLPGRSKSVTLHDTTLEEVWALVETAVMAHVDDAP